MKDRGTERIEVAVRSTYSSRVRMMALRPGESKTQRWSLECTRGWYDPEITLTGDSVFTRTLAGHLETCEPSISDPPIGGHVGP